VSKSKRSAKPKKKGRSMSDNNPTAQSYVDAPAPSMEINTPAEIAQIVTAEAEYIGEAIGELAEETLEQAQASLGRVQEAASAAMPELEATVEAASSGLNDINMKAFGIMKASADAALDYFAALANAKTLPDVVAAQTDFMRKQIETMNVQTRELAKLAEEVSARSIAPINQTLARTFGTAA
jgi:phasin